jgi:hypothetical protein
MAEQGVPVDSRPAVVFSVAPALNEAILETLRIGRTVSVFLPILDMGLPRYDRISLNVKK